MKKDIIRKSEIYVRKLISEKLRAEFFYHNLEHTLEVVNAVKEISKGMNLNSDETENLIIAAWFHDAGNIESIINHEEKSAFIAEKFLYENELSANRIKIVTDLILATKLINTPKNIFEMIIRDADLIHFGKKEFFKRNDLLRLEWEKTLNQFYTDSDWLKSTFEFADKYPFFTEFANEKYGAQRKENLNLIKEKIEKLILRERID